MSWRTALLIAFTWAVIGALIVDAHGLYSWAHYRAPIVRDNPNCFPPGTLRVEDFPMCPDRLRVGFRNT